jgi:hypothetical protein
MSRDLIQLGPARSRPYTAEPPSLGDEQVLGFIDRDFMRGWVSPCVPVSAELPRDVPLPFSERGLLGRGHGGACEGNVCRVDGGHCRGVAGLIQGAGL